MLRTATLIAAVALLCLPNALAAPRELNNAGVGIELRALSSDLGPDTYSVFEIILRNTSNRDQVVYGDLAYGTDLVVRDVSGNAAIPPVLWHSLALPLNLEPDSYVVLHPGHSLSLLDDRSLADLGVTQSGEYSVVATYQHAVTKTRRGFHLALRGEPLKSRAIKVLVHANPE